MSEEVKFPLKVLINEEKTKVLWAEAQGDFCDVLLCFLMVPLGKLVKVLEKHYGDKAPVIGSLTSLYNSLTNPSNALFWTELGKDVLLNARSGLEDAFSHLNVIVDYTVLPVRYDVSSYDGVFTESIASFIIRDDLIMVPHVEGSFFKTLAILGITTAEIKGAEIRDVTFGFNEIMDLLKGSLISRTPLSDLILQKREMDSAIEEFSDLPLNERVADSATVKYTTLSIFWQMYERDVNCNFKMTVVLMIQKSTKKLLFAQANADFIDFLFSILTLPLGRVEWLLDSNTGLGTIDNLYRSIANNITGCPEIKNLLAKPELPHMYASSQFLPLSEEDTHPSLLDNSQNYVKGRKMYMVTNDLTVTPLKLISTLSILEEWKVSLSDVEEVELRIGLQEALSLLTASLTSTTALSDALMFYMLKN